MSYNTLWEFYGLEEPGRLQSMELQSVGHDWAANTFFFNKALKNVNMNN